MSFPKGPRLARANGDRSRCPRGGNHEQGIHRAHRRRAGHHHLGACHPSTDVGAMCAAVSPRRGLGRRATVLGRVSVTEPSRLGGNRQSSFERRAHGSDHGAVAEQVLVAQLSRPFITWIVARAQRVPLWFGSCGDCRRQHPSARQGPGNAASPTAADAQLFDRGAALTATAPRAELSPKGDL